MCGLSIAESGMPAPITIPCATRSASVSFLRADSVSRSLAGTAGMKGSERCNESAPCTSLAFSKPGKTCAREHGESQVAGRTGHRGRRGAQLFARTLSYEQCRSAQRAHSEGAIQLTAL